VKFAAFERRFPIVRDANDPVLAFLGAQREQVIDRRLGELVPQEVVRALVGPWTTTGAPARYEVGFVSTTAPEESLTTS
jgi:hypothetical protein